MIPLIFCSQTHLTWLTWPDIAKFTKSWLPIAIKKTKKNRQNADILWCISKRNASIFVRTIENNQNLFSHLCWSGSYKNTLGVTPQNAPHSLIINTYGIYTVKILPNWTVQLQWHVQRHGDECSRRRLGNRFHTWQKPDELALRLIRQTSKEGDLVVDPFCVYWHVSYCSQ